MKIKYDDGLLKIDFDGNEAEGIALVERIADYEEAKYTDYNAGGLLNGNGNNFDWFKNINGNDNGF
jgi:hypothetical protein